MKVQCAHTYNSPRVTQSVGSKLFLGPSSSTSRYPTRGHFNLSQIDLTVKSSSTGFRYLYPFDVPAFSRLCVESHRHRKVTQVESHLRSLLRVRTVNLVERTLRNETVSDRHPESRLIEETWIYRH